MFYSQRVSNRRRRFNITASFNQSWRTRRPTVAQQEFDESVTLSFGKNITPSTSLAEGRQQDAAPNASRHAIASLAPKVQTGEDEDASGGVPRRPARRLDSATPYPTTTSKAETPQSLLQFVKDLRTSLVDDEAVDSDREPSATADAPTSTLSHNFTAFSFFPTTLLTRKRKIPFRPTVATKQDLATSRADIVRMNRTRKISRPELSLWREIYFQEQYLLTHPSEGGTVKYRQMSAALTRNRQHMLMYKRHKSGWQHLPPKVKDLVMEMAAEIELDV